MKPRWIETGSARRQTRCRFWLVAGLVLIGSISINCRKDTTVTQQPSATSSKAASDLDTTAEASQQYKIAPLAATNKQYKIAPLATANKQYTVAPLAAANKQYTIVPSADTDKQDKNEYSASIDDTPDAQLGPTISTAATTLKIVPETPPPNLPEPKYPTLIEAVKAGDIDDVENHILRGENLNACAENGFTPLHFAAQAGQIEILKLLLDYGADYKINANEGVFSTPIVAAEKAKQWEAAALLRSRGAYCTFKHMVIWGDVPGVEECLTGQPEVINQKSFGIGETPLHWAARYGQKEVVELLLDQGADPDIAELERGSTPFTEAAIHNHAEIVKLMVARGVDVDRRLFYGNTVLHIKAKTGDIELVDLLLSLGADINAKNNKGQTPLHIAVLAQQQKFVELMIDKGALIYAADNKGLSPLHLAAQKGFLEIITFLMDRGASVTRKDRYGRTPLHVAALEGQDKAVALLLERRSEVDARTKRDQTPMHLVIEGSIEEPLTKLILPTARRRYIPPRKQETPIS